MSTQTAENRSHTTGEPLPAPLVDHDALYGVVKRLLFNGKVMVHHIEIGSADVHRDLSGMKAALEAAEQLLDPRLPEAPDDAIVLFARAVQEDDVMWASELGEWVLVRAVRPHELYPDTTMHFSVTVPPVGTPDTLGVRNDCPVAVRRPAPRVETPVLAVQ